VIMMSAIRTGLRTSMLLMMILVRPVAGLTQQVPTEDLGNESTAVTDRAQNPDPAAPNDRQVPIPAAVSEGYFIRALNSARPLGGENGPLQWGWLSVRTLQFNEFYDMVSFDDPAIQLANPNPNETFSQLSAVVMVGRQFKRAKLAVQYQPT